LLIPTAAVSTEVVVIVVAVAVVLIVLLVTLTMHDRQRRAGKRQLALTEARERIARAERDRYIVQDRAPRNDPDS
jgi:uncharacterized membrane protein